MNIILVCPLHDPDSRLLDGIRENGSKLNDIFQNSVVISVTPNTSSEVVNMLKKTQLKYQELSSSIENTLGNNYRNAILLGTGNKTNNIFLVDFDRAIHWARRFPQELEEIQKNYQH